jgi:hypothetical protein
MYPVKNHGMFHSTYSSISFVPDKIGTQLNLYRYYAHKHLHDRHIWSETLIIISGKNKTIIPYSINKIIRKRVIRCVVVTMLRLNNLYHNNTQAEYIKLLWNKISVYVFGWLVSTAYMEWYTYKFAVGLICLVREWCVCTKTSHLTVFLSDSLWSEFLGRKSWTNQNLQVSAPYSCLIIYYQVLGLNEGQVVLFPHACTLNPHKFPW